MDIYEAAKEHLSTCTEHPTCIEAWAFYVEMSASLDHAEALLSAESIPQTDVISFPIFKNLD